MSPVSSCQRLVLVLKFLIHCNTNTVCEYVRDENLPPLLSMSECSSVQLSEISVDPLDEDKDKVG